MIARLALGSLVLLCLAAPSAGAVFVDVADRTLYVNVYTEPRPGAAVPDVVVIFETKLVPANVTTRLRCVAGEDSDLHCHAWTNRTVGAGEDSTSAWAGCFSDPQPVGNTACGFSAVSDAAPEDAHLGAIAGGGSHPGLLFYACTFPDPTSGANECYGLYTDESNGTCFHLWHRDVAGNVTLSHLVCVGV